MEGTLKHTLLVLGFVATTAVAGDVAAPNKPPWEWTDDQRLAVRLDPAAIAQRDAEHEKARQGHGLSLQPLSVYRTPRLVIDGALHPELFLPYELFTCLLDAVDPRYSAAERKVKQEFYDRGLRKIGYRPADFWGIFAPLVARYYRVQRDTEQREPRHDSIDAHVALCRERIVLLEAARERFGRTTFDRILYTVVAPKTFQTGSVPGPDGAAGLKYLSGGCQ
jgi:hypothetical protein